MRGSELLDKLELVDLRFVEEADRAALKLNRHWIKWGAIAACVCLVFYAGMTLLRGPQNLAEDLPLVEVTADTGESMGFEGYMVYDIEELVSANPWNENLHLTTLPVYKNPVSYDENFIVSDPDYETMGKILKETAKLLGAKQVEEITTDEFASQSLSLSVRLPDGTEAELEIDPAQTLKIEFSPAVRLPEKYDFTTYASYADTKDAAMYLKKTFADLIGLKKPVLDVYGGDYTIYLQQKYQVAFFDGAGTIEEQVLNYNFNRTVFYGTEDGEVWLVRRYQPDLSQKVGDYPIITADAAKDLLLSGSYVTSVPYLLSEEMCVERVELVYKSGALQKYYMPYYRFYVEIPELEQDGLKTYGAYYVPAVESQYISNMPKWDGNFNE